MKNTSGCWWMIRRSREARYKRRGKTQMMRLANGLKNDQRIFKTGFTRWSFFNPLEKFF